jgi:nitroreductase
MLLTYLKKRYTAKWWDSQPIEQDKLDAIIECAYLAPSKQGNYDFEIIVLTDSPAGKEFKHWLYWDNTSCLDKVRGKQGPGLRRYNGQVLAPVVMVWLSKHFEQPVNSYEENEFLRTNNDCIISATIAMCQAEELGISTGFCGCIGGREIADKLNRPDLTAIVTMGFGYSTIDTTASIRKVYSNGVEMGFDLANHDSSIRNIENRKNRPPIQSMVNYI